VFILGMCLLVNTIIKKEIFPKLWRNWEVPNRKVIT
jgi:hypothetical protein